MKNLNLLQLVPSLESGGVEQGTIDLANFLAKKNIRSFIVSKGGKMLQNLDKKNVKHIAMDIGSKNFFLMPFVAKKLKKIIEENEINILHVRSRAPAWLLKFIKYKSFKTISTFHNVYGTENVLKKHYNKALADADHIVAISSYVKSTITEIYGIKAKNISVINRGINTDFFNSKISNKDIFIKFVSSYNIPENKKIILFPGRLTEWKGQIKFLNILESYKDKKVICYFIGDDKNKNYTSKLSKYINKKGLHHICKIMGHLPPNDLKMMYICADVIVSAPLKPEGFGRIISEALSMKKIILSYDFGGAKDQLSDLSSLFKITPNDQEELKDRIDKVFNLSRSYIEKLGSISRSHVINNFSDQKMFENYLKLYQKILK